MTRSGVELSLRAARFWKAGGTVSVRLPGLTVVGVCDQQTLTNEGAINETAPPPCKRYFAGEYYEPACLIQISAPSP